MKKKVIVLGGDGYLGWSTSMALSKDGYDVLAVDNYIKRDIALAKNLVPLSKGLNLESKCEIWNEKSKNKITTKIGDLSNWSFVENVFTEFQPDIIIHYAEQPSAPYSMMGRKEALFTLNNNLNVTANIIFAVKEFCPNAHIIKLGTMGEYGTPNIDIEEGWLEITHKGRKDNFLYPRQAGSLYHTTKIMDTDLLWFYVRMHDIRVTDLMQGPVYGILTDESKSDDSLASDFYYDHIFGTCLNRFLVQAVKGMPLTVYGKGEQVRGYLNIKDTLSCVKLSISNPADKGELRIYNQFTELFSVNELAEKILDAGRHFNLKVQIEHIKNPRKEKESHYYNASPSNLLKLGLKPNYLTDDVLRDMLGQVIVYKDKIKEEIILPGISW